MGGTEGLCHRPKILNQTNCETKRIDINGDGKPDLVEICESVTMKFSGDMAECRDQYRDVIPDADKKLIESGNLVVTPLAFLKLMGVSPRICGPKGEDYRGEKSKLGIMTDRKYESLVGVPNPQCNIKLYGSAQGWYLSYPVQKDIGLIIEDLRNNVIGKLPSHRAGDKTIRIGTWGTFTVRNNKGETREIEGLVINFGHHRRFGRAIADSKGNFTSAEFSPSNVNVYLLTKKTKTHEKLGEKVRLTDIVDVRVEEFADVDKETIARKFKKEFRSMKELMDSLTGEK